MSDESLRGFQLNGKQLVFMFMASTIVAVVIFLCGVMVGRGVSAAQAATLASSDVEAGDPTAAERPSPVQSEAPAADPLATPPPVTSDDVPFSAVQDLTAREPRSDVETPKAVANAAAAVASRPKPAALPPAEPVADTGEPTGTGFVVQVAATPRRAEADAIRARLARKGYPTFVTTAGRVFRVRVGKYDSRAEAAAVATRLETQERFKPWVTR